MNDFYFTKLISSECDLELANTEILNLKKELKEVKTELETYKKLFSILKSPI